MSAGPAGSPGGGPIRGHVIVEALAGPDGSAGLWTSIAAVASTGSTNADLLARGGPEGQVLVAEEQTAGRGRAGRTWVSQPGASLTFSVLVRPASVAAVGPRLAAAADRGRGRGRGAVGGRRRGARLNGRMTSWWATGSWPASWPSSPRTATRW